MNASSWLHYTVDFWVCEKRGETRPKEKRRVTGASTEFGQQDTFFAGGSLTEPNFLERLFPLSPGQFSSHRYKAHMCLVAGLNWKDPSSSLSQRRQLRFRETLLCRRQGRKWEHDEKKKGRKELTALLKSPLRSFTFQPSGGHLRRRRGASSSSPKGKRREEGEMRGEHTHV